MAAAAVRTGVSFVGVVGEEIDSKGSRYLIDDRDESPDAVVNGEPSGADGITLGYRGLIAGTYVATSESGHTSRPDPNAIQHAVRWWSAVEDRFEGDEYEPVFEQVTTKPVDIEGGVSDDGLSVEATMDIQLRVPPALDVGTVREAAEGQTRGRDRDLEGQGPAGDDEFANGGRTSVSRRHPQGGWRSSPGAKDRNERHEHLCRGLGLPDGHLRAGQLGPRSRAR